MPEDFTKPLKERKLQAEAKRNGKGLRILWLSVSAISLIPVKTPHFSNFFTIFQDFFDGFSGDDGLKVEGLEVGMVTIVGQVLKVDNADTKTTITIEDSSGTIDAVQWNDENTDTASELQMNGVVEGNTIRVFGSVRSQQDKRYVMAFKTLAVTEAAEKDCHLLEIEHNKLLIRRMNEKENAAIGANYGLSNSMVTSGTGGGSGSSASFGNAKYDSVYKMVAGCDREEGISRDELNQQLTGKMGRKEVDDALEFLSNEGHIYSTTDEDHFKTTDS